MLIVALICMQLPERFFDSAHDDLPRADLLLVMGTSLQVQPFAGLVTRAPLRAPRLLVNRERVGQVHTLGLGGFIFDEGACASVSVPGGGLVVRDGHVAGDTDAAVWELAERLAWREELQAAVDAGRAKHARGRAGHSSASRIELKCTCEGAMTGTLATQGPGQFHKQLRDNAASSSFGSSS